MGRAAKGVGRTPLGVLDAKTPQESGLTVYLLFSDLICSPKQNLGKILNASPSLFGNKTLACVLLSAVQAHSDASANCYHLSYYSKQMKQWQK